MPRYSIVIVSYNTAALLADCLRAVAAQTDLANTEVIVVDNASSDESVAMVARDFPWVHLIAHSENAGFGIGNNLGVRQSSAPYVLLLNSDAILLEDTGAALVDYLERHEDVIAVAPKIVMTNGERQPRVFGNLPGLWHILMQSLDIGSLFPRIPALAGIDGRDLTRPEQNVGWISGVCIAMRRSDYEAVAGFDPALFMYCEDIELCWRLSKRGGRIVRLDRHGVLHLGGGSSRGLAGQLRNAVMQQQNLLQIIAKHEGKATSLAARALIFGGLVMRTCAGLAVVPRRGFANNLLLRTSLRRMRALFA